MKKILLIGASSFIGQSMVPRLGQDRIVATFHSTAIDDGVFFDPLEMDLADLPADLSGFSHAVLLYAMTSPAACHADAALSKRVNVKSAIRIIDGLADRGITPVFLSTEAVFDGKTGSYTEEDTPNPLFTYARQKYEVERYLNGLGKPALIARLARVYGSQAGDGTLFTDILHHLTRNQPIRCAGDQVFSPIHVEDAVDALSLLMEAGQTGTFHIGGPSAISKCEAVEMTVNRYTSFGGDYTAAITACRLAEFDLAEPRPLNISLSVEKLRQTVGIGLQGPEEQCREIVERHFSALAKAKDG